MCHFFVTNFVLPCLNDETQRRNDMRYMIKRYLKPTDLLMIFGFTLSMSAILVGISSMLQIIQYAKQFNDGIPIAKTIQNSGISVMILIYLFSIVNCLAVVNYKMIAEKRTYAIKQAFGATNGLILKEIAVQMSVNLLISLLLGGIVILLLTKSYPKYFSVYISPVLIACTLVMLLLTLVIAMVIPFIRVTRIYPAEVVK